MRGDIGGERRGYRSPLREERAADTRRRIGTAALGLFTEHGFGATTVAAIAERSGVSVQTVYATFGSKGAILRAILAQWEENAHAADWRERIAAEPDPRGKLTAFAQWSAGLFSSSKAVIAAAQGAAGDPALLELRAEADGHRRAALDTLVGTREVEQRVAGRAEPQPGGRPGLDPDRGGVVPRSHRRLRLGRHGLCRVAGRHADQPVARTRAISPHAGGGTKAVTPSGTAPLRRTSAPSSVDRELYDPAPTTVASDVGEHHCSGELFGALSFGLRSGLLGSLYYVLRCYVRRSTLVS